MQLTISLRECGIVVVFKVASSSASCRDCRPPSNFVNGRTRDLYVVHGLMLIAFTDRQLN